MSVEEFDKVIGKTIEVEGQKYMVSGWSTAGGWTVKPLGEVLAEHILVEGDEQVMTLADALVQAGWVAPGRDKDGDTFTELSRAHAL